MVAKVMKTKKHNLGIISEPTRGATCCYIVISERVSPSRERKLENLAIACKSLKGS